MTTNETLDTSDRKKEKVDQQLLIPRLEAAMAKQGLKPSDVAAAISVSRSAMSYFLSGKRQPGRQVLSALADRLSVTVDYLLGLTDEVNTADLLKNPRVLELVKKFQILTDTEQQRVLEMVDLISKTAKQSSPVAGSEDQTSKGGHAEEDWTRREF